MRVSVDPAKCQGHTLCAMTAPDVFELNDEDGHSYVPNERVAPEDEEGARKAFASCPERAIVLVED